jgi:hypothetical protein
MNQKFVGGLYISGFHPEKLGIHVRPAPICLIPTEEKLEFQARYGLHHLIGPWTAERQRVTGVYRLRGALGFRSLIRIEGQQDLQLTFATSRPDEVLHSLEELGYPVQEKLLW